jgi:O-antigen ligase
VNLSIFITATIWLKIVSDQISKPTMQKVGIKLTQIFAVALIGFSVANAVVSVSQFADCSGSSQGCQVWKAIDKTFPNKLLLVGHQKFAYKPIVIRSPGFFGDVNFNGMISLLITTIAAAVYLLLELLTKEKGYIPAKEKKLLLIPIIAGLTAYLLTLSRSALLGTGAIVVVLAIILFIPLIKQFGVSATAKKRLALLGGGTFIAVVVLFALGFLIPLSHNNRKTSLSGEILIYAQQMINPNEKSAAGHADLFGEAIKIGNQKPLTGMGLGTFSAEYTRVIDPKHATANPHSTYGMLYAEQGIIGVLGYTMVIITLWATAIKALKSFTKSTITQFSTEKRPTREQFVSTASILFLLLIGFGVPFFSVATISYYGFFLPMTWWWGNKELVS